MRSLRPPPLRLRFGGVCCIPPLHSWPAGSRLQQTSNPMNSKHVLVLSAGIVVLIGVFTLRSSRKPFPNSESVAVNLSASTEHSDAARPTRSAEAAMNVAKLPRRHPPAAPSEELPGGTNKLERLTQIRQLFHSLATGDPGTALGLAKQITDPTERETALLSLVTEWTH